MLLSLLSAYEEHESPQVRAAVGLCLRQSILHFPDLDTVALRISKLEKGSSSVIENIPPPVMQKGQAQKEQEKCI